MTNFVFSVSELHKSHFGVVKVSVFFLCSQKYIVESHCLRSNEISQCDNNYMKALEIPQYRGFYMSGHFI